MGLGVLEDHNIEHVPGTAPLNELERKLYSTNGVDSCILKHDPTGKIILIPQLADSPNDPYNWSRAKNERFTIRYGFGCGAVGGRSSISLINPILNSDVEIAIGPLLGAAFVELSTEFNVPLSTFISGVQGGLIVPSPWVV